MKYTILNISNSPYGLKGSTYTFKSSNGVCVWPKENGFYLGVAGIWNFLFRLGIKPKLITFENLIECDIETILFVTLDVNPSNNIKEFLKKWINKGKVLIASGHSEAWLDILGIEGEILLVPYPYAAFGYVCFGGDGNIEIVAPPKWPFMRVTERSGGGDVGLIGNLVAIRGERQTPSRALISPLENAPAIIRKRNSFYLNGAPFNALQAWLQGQEDLGPWLHWRHRLFWLDEMVLFLKNTLIDIGALPEEIRKSKIPGMEKITVVLRHDLDSSRDTSYIDLEDAHGVPAVHAVLKDRNTGFWVNLLKSRSNHESAFHYNTVENKTWYSKIRQRLGVKARGYKPARREIAGKGLLKQVQWAKRHGIGVSTLHRHFSFLIYPEWIDAMDFVFSEEEEVLGSSSVFRAIVLRWGIDCADGASGTTGEFPDPQFPFWFPFKLAHAGRGGQVVRGWESTSVMEIEPELFEQIVNHAKKLDLPHFVFTLSFHPAHAKNPTFCEKGSVVYFRSIIESIINKEIPIRTLAHVYSFLNER